MNHPAPPNVDHPAPINRPAPPKVDHRTPQDVDPALYWAGRMYTYVRTLLCSPLAEAADCLKLLEHAARRYNDEIFRRAQEGAAVVRVTSPTRGINPRCVWLNLGSKVPVVTRNKVRRLLADLFGLLWGFESERIAVEFMDEKEHR